MSNNKRLFRTVFFIVLAGAVFYLGCYIPAGLVHDYWPLLRAPGVPMLVLSAVFDAAVFFGLFGAICFSLVVLWRPLVHQGLAPGDCFEDSEVSFVIMLPSGAFWRMGMEDVWNLEDAATITSRDEAVLEASKIPGAFIFGLRRGWCAGKETFRDVGRVG